MKYLLILIFFTIITLIVWSVFLHGAAYKFFVLTPAINSTSVSFNDSIDEGFLKELAK
jgi:hypothetical protein